MNWVSRSMVACGIISLVALPPTMASAEWFADLYGDATLPGHATASHTQTQPTAANLTRQLDLGAGPALGILAGNWFARFPWLGVAGDLSYFSRSAERTSVSAVPISLLFMQGPSTSHNALPLVTPEQG